MGLLKSLFVSFLLLLFGRPGGPEKLWHLDSTLFNGKFFERWKWVFFAMGQPHQPNNKQLLNHWWKKQSATTFWDLAGCDVCYCDDCAWHRIVQLHYNNDMLVHQKWPLLFSRPIVYPHLPWIWTIVGIPVYLYTVHGSVMGRYSWESKGAASPSRNKALFILFKGSWR